MIRKTTYKENIINLDGQHGNAFYLLGIANNYAKQHGYDSKKILDEMRAGDYKNLIKVFSKYFPFVILETEQKDLLN